MDKELEQYYEETFGMMATQGWTYLLEDFTKLKDAVNDLSTVSSSEELHFRKGQLDILQLVLKRKETCEKVYEELQSEQIL